MRPAPAPYENRSSCAEAEDPPDAPARESEAPPTTVKVVDPASAPAAPVSPNWTQLSDSLRALIATTGSIPVNDLSGRYSSMYNRQLNLRGHKLKRSIENGSIRGLRYNAGNQTVDLEETTIASVREPEAPAKTTGKTMPTTKAAAVKTPPTNPGSPDWASLSKGLRVLAITKGPLSLSEVGQAYKSKYNKNLNLRGHDLRASLVSGDLPGVRYNASTSKLEVDATREGATRATKAPPAPQRVKQRTRKETAVAKSHAAVEGQTRPGSDTGERQRSAPVVEKKVSAPTQPPYLLIDSPSSYVTALATLSLDGALGHTLQQVCMGSMVVVQLSGRQLGYGDGPISLIKLQIVGTTSHPPVIFDVVKLSKTKTCQNLLLNKLFPLFADQRSTKVVYDFSNSAIALRRQFGAGFTIGRIMDLQLAFEALHGRFGADVVTVLRAFGQQVSYNDAVFRSLSCEEASTMRRPIDTTTLGLATQAVTSLAKVAESAVLSLSKNGQKDIVLEASQRVAEFAMSSWRQDTRRVAFRNHGSCWGGGVGRILTSFELKQVFPTRITSCMVSTGWRFRQAREKVGLSTPSGQGLPSNATPAVIDDTDPTYVPLSALDSLNQNDGVTRDPNSPHEILKLIPEEFLEEHLTERHVQNRQDLNELVLDEGRRPYATLQGRGKLFLCSDKSVVVTKEHIDRVVGRLDLEGKFAGDNRAGVPGQLHRISVMRSREGRRIFGVTLRIGRYFPGSAGLVDDLLFHVQSSPDKPERAASVLVLGKPGSGKTTVLRDICRKISEEQTVVIVDTSNEIAGDGHIPHLAAIGQSRRMMVPDKAGQHK
ncbi:unnamed protein product [Ectocarpus fasciculatus]